MNTDKNQEKKDKAKIGVFVCHCGGNISDVVDVETVTNTISKDPRVSVAENFIFMCSDPGQQLISEKIKEMGLTHVIVAACSPKLHELTFRKVVAKSGLNPYLYEHVNIREQDSWVHSHEPEKATEKAIRLIEGAINRLTLQNPLSPSKKKTIQNGIVIGGGVSGLSAALDLAERGITVDLIEKSPFLGGRVVQLEKLYPNGEDAKTLVQSLIQRVLEHPLITVYLNSEVIASSGSKGSYEIRIKQTPRGVEDRVEGLEDAIQSCPVEVDNEFEYGLYKRRAIYKPYSDALPDLPAIDWKNCTKCGNCVRATNGKGINLDAEPSEITLYGGAIILATGFNPYLPETGEYGYGETPFVITLPQLIRVMEHIDPEDRGFIYNGKQIKSVAFIHCVGSRQIEGIHKPKNGKLNTYCSRICCSTGIYAAARLKERFPNLKIAGLYRDIRTYGFYEDIYEVASRSNVIFFKFDDTEIPEVNIESSSGGLEITMKDELLRGRQVAIDADLVVLNVGMEPSNIQDLIKILSVPTGNGGFLQEVHPKLRPVESQMEGIFIAGTAQAPMNIQESILAATAAAAKAANILVNEEIELSPFVAKVDPLKCSGTGQCIKECEYNAITLINTDDGQQRAVIDPSLCSGCGACVPACPSRAIELQGYALEQIEAQIEGMIKGVPTQ